MKVLLTLATAALAMQASFAANPTPTSSASASAATAQVAATWTAGEIKKLDAQGARVTLQHGDIKNLNMPAMTMVFRLRRPDMLQGFKVGDKVRFQAEMDGNDMVVTQWARVQP